MRIKDYFIDKRFFSLTASQVFRSRSLGVLGNWSYGPRVLILDYAIRLYQ